MNERGCLDCQFLDEFGKDEGGYHKRDKICTEPSQPKGSIDGVLHLFDWDKPNNCSKHKERK
jgi:hypothetical protein